MINRKTMMAIIAIATITGCGTTETGKDTSIDKEKFVSYKVEQSNPVDKEDMLALINDFRSRPETCGDEYLSETTDLVWSEKLTMSASSKAYDLAESDYFGHGGSETSSDEVETRGVHFKQLINMYGTMSRTVGENIGKGRATLEEVFEAWVESPKHCSNMMSPKYTQIGLASWNDTNGYEYTWVQHFASK